MTDALTHDAVAEQSVLGAMLLSRDAISDITDILDGGDFYQPAHETIYRTILEVNGSGKPVDAITINDALTKAGDITLAGGPSYTHTLALTVPSASAGAYYAEIVANAATRRRLTVAGRKIQELAGSGGDVDELVEASRREVDQTSRATGSVVQSFGETIDIMLGTLDEEINHRPTPWAALNQVIGGLRPGALYVVGARPSVGKALALDTPIPTPTGWTTMGEIAVGDQVIGMDGKPARVVAATDVMEDRPCYRVTFKDGSQIIADEQHQWLTSTRSARRAATPPAGYEFKRDSKYSRDQRHMSDTPGIKTTGEIFDTQRTGNDARVNHVVPVATAFEGVATDLPLDPYLFGYWLGDGSSRWSTVTLGSLDYQAFCDQVDARGYFRTDHRAESGHTVHISNQPIKRGGDQQRDSMQKRLKGLGVLLNKHIPMTYQRAPEAQRRDLMAGLLDSDGTASKQNGRVSFAVTSEKLARDFEELARSLGYVTYMSTKRVEGRREDSSTCFTVSFMADRAVFGLARKNALLKLDQRNTGRPIVKVEKVESVPVRCIQIDNGDHMYLCGEGFIPTHNSVVALNLAQGLAAHGSVAFSSLEMSNNDVQIRAVSADLNLDVGRLIERNLSPGDWAKIRDRRASWSDVPLFVDDRSGVTMTDIKRFARSVNRRKPLAGIVVDYLQLMSQPQGDKRPRHEFVADMSRQLKIMAMDMQIPVIALSQLNRGSTQREDKMPQISDLRESGAVEQDADVVILLHREIMGDLKNDMSMLVAKNRHGATGLAQLTFWGQYSKCLDAGITPQNEARTRA